MKKGFVYKLLFGVSLILFLNACSPAEKEKTNEETLSVGILQLVEHGSLDQAYSGFVEGLEEEGFKEGENITFNYQNAQGTQDNLKNMSEKIVKDQPDLILGIATLAGLSLQNETTDIPILVTAVTDLVEVGLVNSNKEPSGNISGTSDLGPIKKQVQLLLDIIPDAKTIGIMYNAGEGNSVIQATEAKEYLEEKGIQVKELTATSTNDVQQVTTSLAKDVDGIYIPTDNLFASSMAVVGDVAKEYKIPVVPGSIDMVEQGGLATYGIDYYLLGKQTARMAVKVLNEGQKPQDLPVETSTDIQLIVNQEMAKALNIDPDSIKAP